MTGTRHARSRGRLEEVRDDSVVSAAQKPDARGRLCEVEGRTARLAGAEDRLTQIYRQRQKAAIRFGRPRTGSGALSSYAQGEVPARDLSTWTLDRLWTFIHGGHGQELETARVAAQQQAYNACHAPEVRRQWAKLSLLANRRMPDSTAGDSARVAQQDFMLRTWVIDHLGPDDTDPDWSPQALTSDTLAALTLTPAQAADLAAAWCGLPIEQIRELRRHKNLTAHLDSLVGHLEPGPVRERLLAWSETRRLLP